MFAFVFPVLPSSTLLFIPGSPDKALVQLQGHIGVYVQREHVVSLSGSSVSGGFLRGGQYCMGHRPLWNCDVGVHQHHFIPWGRVDSYHIIPGIETCSHVSSQVSLVLVDAVVLPALVNYCTWTSSLEHFVVPADEYLQATQIKLRTGKWS